MVGGWSRQQVIEAWPCGDADANAVAVAVVGEGEG